jgi:hypothetical protein
MKKNVIVIGMGEMGSVFARGCLKLGYTVTPITRKQAIEDYLDLEPEAVFITVGEADLHSVLSQIPEKWKIISVLIQNELLPRDWQAHSFENPTVISVWFEKKKGMDSKVVISSVSYGPKSRLLFDLLNTLDIPVYTLQTQGDLLYELVRKNLYILTTNIAGLVVGGTVNELQTTHKSLLYDVAKDVMDIQDWLTNTQQPRSALLHGLELAFKGDPDHKCMGRSAKARLERALGFASEAGLAVPTLRKIAEQVALES